ncbi:MAG: N-acetylmuramoyl-L-alanine amidase [Clostridia bacterium]|nr:N-acetylmuramoyl-L-alanine amidase [Clostridia bacterium]
MKILLISGHGANDPGACSSYGTEATETRKVVNELKTQLSKYNVTVDVYPQNRNCYSDVLNGSFQLNVSNYNYVLEIHFNSAENVLAKGVEIFTTYAEAATTVEQAIVNNIAKLGFTNRGVKKENFAVINYVKNKGVSSALLETCFISNKEDMDRYKAKFKQICEAIVNGIVNEFGIAKKQTPTPVSKELYRVRSSWTDAASQKGAFSDVNNAIKCCDNYSGYNVYNSTGFIVYSNTKNSAISVGSKVRIKGKNYATGEIVPTWVKKKLIQFNK